MNEKQRTQIVDFIPNYVSLLHDAGFSPQQATEAVHSALACIFATIFRLPTTVTLSEEEQQFLLAVQVQAINMFYGRVVA